MQARHCESLIECWLQKNARTVEHEHGYAPWGNTLIVIVQLSVILAVGLVLLIWAWHRPGWAIFAAISISALMELLQIESNGVHLGMFGINLMPEDAAWIILLV